VTHLDQSDPGTVRVEARHGLIMATLKKGKGVCCYDATKLSGGNLLSRIQGLDSTKCRSIDCDRNGNVLVSRGGTLVFLPSAGVRTPLSCPVYTAGVALSDDNIQHVIQSSAYLLIVTPRGISVYVDRGVRKVGSYDKDRRLMILEVSGISRLSINPANGDIYCSTGSRVYHISKMATERVVQTLCQQPSAQKMTHDGM
ncbi:hypothetical protein KIPB_010382, partial [Kipferlia bialata]